MPKYKYIRIEKNYQQAKYIEDVSFLPFSMIYGIEDPTENLEIFKDILSECINNHAPLKCVKVTRLPAPWLQNETIRNLQSLRNKFRYEAHMSKAPGYLTKISQREKLVKEED